MAWPWQIEFWTGTVSGGSELNDPFDALEWIEGDLAVKPWPEDFKSRAIDTFDLFDDIVQTCLQNRLG